MLACSTVLRSAITLALVLALAAPALGQAQLHFITTSPVETMPSAPPQASEAVAALFEGARAHLQYTKRLARHLNRRNRLKKPAKTDARDRLAAGLRGLLVGSHKEALRSGHDELAVMHLQAWLHVRLQELLWIRAMEAAELQEEGDPKVGNHFLNGMSDGPDMRFARQLLRQIAEDPRPYAERSVASIQLAYLLLDEGQDADALAAGLAVLCPGGQWNSVDGLRACEAKGLPPRLEALAWSDIVGRYYFSKSGENDRAVVAFEKSVQADSGSVASQFRLGHALYLAKRHAAAMDAFFLALQKGDLLEDESLTYLGILIVEVYQTQTSPLTLVEQTDRALDGHGRRGWKRKLFVSVREAVEDMGMEAEEALLDAYLNRAKD